MSPAAAAEATSMAQENPAAAIVEDMNTIVVACIRT
jgi:hypothetical protein